MEIISDAYNMYAAKPIQRPNCNSYFEHPWGNPQKQSYYSYWEGILLDL